MSDTIKIQRPSERRSRAPSGRVERDERGNAVWVRTRATDPQELTIDSTLSLADDPHSPTNERADRDMELARLAALSAKHKKR